MMAAPTLSRFKLPIARGFSPFCVIAGDTIPSLLDSAKLSLPANTHLGTRVKITDGFVVSGAGDTSFNKFYFVDGSTEQGAPRYIRFPLQSGNSARPTCFYRESGQWILWDDVSQAPIDTADTSGENFPWQATWPVITLTHPAVQELTAPSTAQGGVFVSGGSQDGIYGINAVADNVNGKRSFVLLGFSGNDDHVFRWSNDINAEMALGPSAAGWTLQSSTGGALVYYSLSDVATPDLAGSDKFVMAVSGIAYSKRGTFNGKSYYNKIGEATSTSLSAIFWSSATWHITNAIGVDLDTSTSAVATPDLATFLLGTVVSNVTWLNASDDSPASITVTSVSVGELAAGLKDQDDFTYVAQGSQNGRLQFVPVINDTAHGSTIFWDGVDSWDNGDGSLFNEDIPFAWTGEDNGLVRDNVASEANWNNV